MFFKLAPLVFAVSLMTSCASTSKEEFRANGACPSGTDSGTCPDMGNGNCPTGDCGESGSCGSGDCGTDGGCPTGGIMGNAGKPGKCPTGNGKLPSGGMKLPTPNSGNGGGSCPTGTGCKTN